MRPHTGKAFVDRNPYKPPASFKNMGWMSTVRGDVTMLITPGYVPDRGKIDEALTRYLNANECKRDVPKDAEERAAWLLGSLARRHVAYYYKRKQRVRELILETWVIQEGGTNGGGFEAWFALPAASSQDSRLYLHAYPRAQVGRTLATNVFAYPHKQLGTRRGRYAGEAEARASSKGFIESLAETYASTGKEAATALLRKSHEACYSPGAPAR